MCKPCYKEHKPEFSKLDKDPPSVVKVRSMLWGQRYRKNHKPHIRARIAYAAHNLAQAGEDHLLESVRETLERQRGPLPDVEELPDEEVPERVKTVEKELSALESALDPVYKPKIDKPGDFRTKDGHFVRSKSEVAICNYLFDHGIRYQYERRIFLGEQELHPDFYLPDQKLYLEHFGLLDNPRYKEYAHKKAELFKEHDVPLIATDEDMFKREGVENTLYRKLRTHIQGLEAPE